MEPGSLSQTGAVAGLHVRNYNLQDKINYTEKIVESKIIKSQNLKQDNNSIHKMAIAWKTRLDASISQEVKKQPLVKEVTSSTPDEDDIITLKEEDVRTTGIDMIRVPE
jgi:hypothetical protein